MLRSGPRIVSPHDPDTHSLSLSFSVHTHMRTGCCFWRDGLVAGTLERRLLHTGGQWHRLTATASQMTVSTLAAC